MQNKISKKNWMIMGQGEGEVRRPSVMMKRGLEDL